MLRGVLTCSQGISERTALTTALSPPKGSNTFLRRSGVGWGLRKGWRVGKRRQQLGPPSCCHAIQCLCQPPPVQMHLWQRPGTVLGAARAWPIPAPPPLDKTWRHALTGSHSW